MSRLILFLLSLIVLTACGKRFAQDDESDQPDKKPKQKKLSDMEVILRTTDSILSVHEPQLFATYINYRDTSSHEYKFVDSSQSSPVLNGRWYVQSYYPIGHANIYALNLDGPSTKEFVSLVCIPFPLSWNNYLLHFSYSEGELLLRSMMNFSSKNDCPTIEFEKVTNDLNYDAWIRRADRTQSHEEVNRHLLSFTGDTCREVLHFISWWVDMTEEKTVEGLRADETYEEVRELSWEDSDGDGTVEGHILEMIRGLGPDSSRVITSSEMIYDWDLDSLRFVRR